MCGCQIPLLLLIFPVIVGMLQPWTAGLDSRGDFAPVLHEDVVPPQPDGGMEGGRPEGVHTGGAAEKTERIENDEHSVTRAWCVLPAGATSS